MNRLKPLLIFFGILTAQFHVLSSSATASLFCDEIRAIANDQGKLNYLRSWVRNNRYNNNLLKLGFNSGWTFYRDRPEAFKRLDLDLEYLGIRPESARLSVLPVVEDVNGPDIDAYELQSVSVSRGRDFVSIKVKQKNGQYKDTGWEDIFDMDEIAEDVSIHCN